MASCKLKGSFTYTKAWIVSIPRCVASLIGSIPARAQLLGTTCGSCLAEELWHDADDALLRPTYVATPSRASRSRQDGARAQDARVPPHDRRLGLHPPRVQRRAPRGDDRRA